jgi:hypothetical protein
LRDARGPKPPGGKSAALLVSVAGPGLQEGVPLVGTTPEKLTVPPTGVVDGETLMLAPAALAGDDASIAGTTEAVAIITPTATANALRRK